MFKTTNSSNLLSLFRNNSVYIVALVILAVALFFRFYNYHNSLYFIYDQGRDAWKLQEIATGNLTLIGPTTGLPGFFLGPLWYYIGVPGYILSQGSPYGISLWYIFLASLALPFFWLISRQLFPKQPVWQIASFAVLSFVPGSVQGSIFIWNPLIAIPLMAAALWFFFKARKSRLSLMAAFFLIGLVLQSEFAYAVFIIPVLYLIIFWIRQRLSLIDYLLAGVAVGVTLLPQLAFEIKNNFVMTRALLSSSGAEGTTFPLTLVWQVRPFQLLAAVQDLLFGGMVGGRLLVWFAVFLMVAGLVWLLKYARKQLDEQLLYYWQITAILAIVPFVGYMFWTGNYGAFFSYYVTPHFIFLVLLVLLGAKTLFEYSVPARLIGAKTERQQRQQVFGASVVVMLLTVSWLTVADVVIWPRNAAGIKAVDDAIGQLLVWERDDRNQVALSSQVQYTSSATTFTPNFLTAQYDYFLHWKAGQFGMPVPHTQARAEDAVVYALIEPDRDIPEKRFMPWYQQVSQGRVLVRRRRLGNLLLETWVQPDFAKQYGLPTSLYQTIEEQMGW